MSNLASTYGKQGRLLEAAELAWKALEGRKRVLGQNHIDTLWTRDMLIDIYERSGQWEAAADIRKGVY